jgi:hypothetical protein
VGDNTVFTSVKPTALGTGFDALQGSLTAVKRIDPLVFFGTYSYAHNFSDRKGGVEVDIGDSHEIRFGTILATSPDTSLRAAFDLTFFEKTRFGGRSLSGTDEPAGIFESVDQWCCRKGCCSTWRSARVSRTARPISGSRLHCHSASKRAA